MASRIQKLFIALLVAVLAGVYQVYLRPAFRTIGVFPRRAYKPVGNQKCRKVAVSLQACEKLVLHQPTGNVYLACSFPEKRRLWMPSLGLFDADGSGSDYIAQYNPETGTVMRMKFGNMKEFMRLSTHGFDVVTSSEKATDLWFYVINHRRPEKGDPKVVGADSVVQIFKGTTIEGKGYSRLNWIQTVNSEHIKTPNDIVGDSKGKSFYWTNDHGSQTGALRNWEGPLRLAQTSVGYCHVDKGCKIAASELQSSNGIASARNGTYYVGSILGHIQVMTKQKDNTLVFEERIELDRSIDNLSVDADGALWAAGFPRVDHVLKNFKDPTVQAGSSALRVTKNTGESSFFGKKYNVDTVLEDDGSLISAATTVAVDSKRKRMFFHGLMAPYFTQCDME